MYDIIWSFIMWFGGCLSGRFLRFPTYFLLRAGCSSPERANQALVSSWRWWRASDWNQGEVCDHPLKFNNLVYTPGTLHFWGPFIGVILYNRGMGLPGILNGPLVSWPFHAKWTSQVSCERIDSSSRRDMQRNQGRSDKKRAPQNPIARLQTFW